MQGNDETERIQRHSLLKYHWSTVKVVNFPVMPPHINSPCSWEKRKTWLVGEYHLVPLVCKPVLVISTQFNFFWMLIVESRVFQMAVLLWYPALLSSRRTVLVKTEQLWYWFTQQSLWWQLLMLPSHNAFYCGKFGKFGSSAGITPVAEWFSVLFEFQHDPWYGSFQKTKLFCCF